MTSSRILAFLSLLLKLLFLPCGLDGKLNHHLCDVPTLLISGSEMAINMCHLYNDSHLDKLNGFVLTPGANVTLQNYNFQTDECGDFYSMPMNIYFPLVFRVEHSCLAAIPVWSSVDHDANRVYVTGYGELIVATQSKIKEITFIYTQVNHDCTLQLESMIMLDVQCAGRVTLSTSSTPSSSSKTSSPKPTSSLTTSTKSFFDVDRYTGLRDIPGKQDSYNNPVYHMQSLRVCPVKHPKYKLILTRATYKHAHLACLRKGMRLATVGRQDLAGAIDLVGACLGGGRAVWIKGYWRRDSNGTNRCLELVSGDSPRQGTISQASSCEKEQAVLCEEAYLSA